MNDSQTKQDADTVASLQAEIGRLQGLLQGKFNRETLLLDMEGSTLNLKGGAAALLAEMFALQFDQEKGQNYIEVRFTSNQVLPGEQFVVTVQKVAGQTPHELRRAAEAHSAGLARQIAELSAIPVPQPTVDNVFGDDLLSIAQVNDIANTVRDQCGSWAARKVRSILSVPTFQGRVHPWMQACFGPEIAADGIERNHRFLEEALELVQSTGCTRGEAHQLVDYVFNRPVGERHQEVGGVMVTLAALCLAHGLDMHQCGEIELARIWTMVEKIRAKQAAKPKHSPLPVHVDANLAAGNVETQSSAMLRLVSRSHFLIANIKTSVECEDADGAYATLEMLMECIKDLANGWSTVLQSTGTGQGGPV